MFKLISSALKFYLPLVLMLTSFSTHPVGLDSCSIYDENGKETGLSNCDTEKFRFVSGKKGDYTEYYMDNRNVPESWFKGCLSDKSAFAEFNKTRAINTANAYTEFISKYPNSYQVNEAKTAIESFVISDAFNYANKVNTIDAFAQFVKDYPNAPQAKEVQDIVWQTAMDQAKRSNTVSAYAQFIKDHPSAPQTKDAKDRVSGILEPPIRSAESAYKCEDAKRLNDQFASADMPSIFDFDRCVAERKFHNVLTGANPQSMYLAGVKYENDGERGKAKKVYLTIMDKFSEHAMALKAADRLAGMNDVAAVEDAQWRTRQAIENSNEQARRASQEAANRQDRSKRDFCSGKSKCENSCGGLQGSSHYRCYSACQATYSGC